MFIDEQKWSNGRKNNVTAAYRDWCISKGFSYRGMKYRIEEKLPYIPTEREIDQLIGGFKNSKYAAFLQLLKETGFRPVEAAGLTLYDFDLNRRIVTLNQPAKNGRPR